MIQLILAGLRTVLEETVVWRPWEANIEQSKPTLDAYQHPGAFVDYAQVLHHRGWLSEFLAVCNAEMNGVRTSDLRDKRIWQSKFVGFILALVSLLSKDIGDRAFHVITALSGM